METSHHLSVIFVTSVRDKFIMDCLMGALYDNGLAFKCKAHNGTFRPSEPSWIEGYN